MKILLVRNDKLGDFITALPLAYLLKRDKPEVSIAMLCAPLTAPLARECSFIDEVIEDEASTLALSKKLKSSNIDVAITLFSNLHVALAERLAGIKVRIAPATKIVQFLYTHRYKQRRSEVKMSEFAYNIDLAYQYFGEFPQKFPSPLLAYELDSYAEFCERMGISKRVIAFHIGSGGSSDANWSVDEYIQLIDAIKKQRDIDIVMTFGPDESSLMQEVASKIDKRVHLYQSNEGLVAFAKVIAGFDLFVSTSTGTFHLASLVGTPTMTFFADTRFASPTRWRGVGDIALQHNYQIPTSLQGRKEMLLHVKEELKALVV